MIFDPVINLTDKDIFRTERGKRSGTIRRMGLEKVLSKKRNAIVGDWFDMVAKTYAPDTAQFLKRNKDPFSNPVGGYLTKGLAGLFDQLLTGMDREAVRIIARSHRPRAGHTELHSFPGHRFCSRHQRKSSGPI